MNNHTGLRVLVSDPIDESGLAGLKAVAEVDVMTDLGPEQLRAVIGHYDALMVRSQTRVTAEIIAAGQRLRIIGRAGVGVDNIDVAAASAHGIVVVNSPDGNTVAAAEHTLALMFALARHVAPADASAKRGEWKRTQFMGVELFGKTLGVIGLGRIGSHVATVARAMGMTVLAHDPFVPAERAEALGIQMTSLEAILGRADVVTLHMPKAPGGRALLDAERLALCKPGMRLINGARGGLVDEAALVEALQTGRIAAAALDVFATEPVISEALRALGDRVLLTPHLGASTAEAQLKVAVDVAGQIAEVLQGVPARTPVNFAQPQRPQPHPAETEAPVPVMA
jgi:D-3-phosphoglycerate dehydrogenase